VLGDLDKELNRRGHSFVRYADDIRIRSPRGPFSTQAVWRRERFEPVRCPRQDSNLRTALRRRVLYPLSYGGSQAKQTKSSDSMP
jgi:hypothetical protein